MHNGKAHEVEIETMIRELVTVSLGMGEGNCGKGIYVSE
jgi:hypothetical protein